MNNQVTKNLFTQQILSFLCFYEKIFHTEDSKLFIEKQNTI